MCNAKSRGLYWLALFPRFALLLVLGLLGGCGLSDYERRMAEEQARLQTAEESRYLGEPVRWPPEGEAGSENRNSPSVSFRPPKGGSPTYERQPLDAVLFVYPGAGDFQMVYLAVGSGRRSDDFRRKLLERVVLPPRAQWQPVVVQPSGRDLMRFEALYHESANVGGRTASFVYLLDEENQQVAIVYQVDAANADKSEVLNAMDQSLRSLAVGARASRGR